MIESDVFVPIVALVTDGHAGELFIDRQEAETFDRNPSKQRLALSQLVFVHMWACFGDFQVRPRRQGCTPDQALKTIRIVHHRHRMGEKGTAHRQQEPQ